MTNLEVLEFSHGLHAQNLERELLQISKTDGWKAPNRDFSGGNELFLNNPFPILSPSILIWQRLDNAS